MQGTFLSFIKFGCVLISCLSKVDEEGHTPAKLKKKSKGSFFIKSFLHFLGFVPTVNLAKFSPVALFRISGWFTRRPNNVASAVPFNKNKMLHVYVHAK